MSSIRCPSYLPDILVPVYHILISPVNIVP